MNCPAIASFERYYPQRFYYRPGEVYHLGKKHLYLNFDLTEEVNRFDEIGIKSGHRVHIFFSRRNMSIDNNKLADFVIKCGEVTNRPVVIHVPIDRPILAKLVKGTVYNLNNCKIVEEESDNRTTFVNKDGDVSSVVEITVGWNLGGEKNNETI